MPGDSSQASLMMSLSRLRSHALAIFEVSRRDAYRRLVLPVLDQYDIVVCVDTAN